uniref:PWWP domain-containing protein n=1 Tax=Leersia perrieri TaxID=77586 RepID=A0A0D9WHF4_9ORYZ
MTSAPVAIASVDCGGVKREGDPDPKLVGYLTGGEVTMMVEGAAAELARVVKAERKVVAACEVVMADDAAGGGIGVVGDLLFATGSAAVAKDSGMRELDGGSAEERMLGVEIGGFGSEAEWTLVPVGAAATETSEEVLDTAALQYSEKGLTGEDHRARYRLPPLDKDGLRASGLVWSKLKGHPWWPAEIFDTSDASELALRHHKKGSHLVAYFGGDTFAWCDESQLKPFMANYSEMVNQSNSDAFISSVNIALEEISRRILSGMCCPCLREEFSDNGMSYMVEHPGLRDGVTCSRVTQAEILECFSPENLLTYIKTLALFPGQGGALLDLVIACSQLTSFYQSNRCHELASACIDDDMDSSSTKNVLLPEAVTYDQEPCEDKPTCEKRPEHALELTEENSTSSLNNTCTSDYFMGLNIIGKAKRKRSEKKEHLPSPEVHTTDHRQDSWYGSGDDPTDTLREASAKMRPRRKHRSPKETLSSSDLSSHEQHLQLGLLAPKKQIQLIERSIIHVDEQKINEIMPKALVLTFVRSAALPSEVDLIRLFSRYGPLKETVTEVHQDTVKVVFKRCLDAESAFGAVGKCSYFGPWLRSFRLVNMPFSLSKSSPEDPGTGVPACRESGMDNVQVDIISKVDKAESVKKASAFEMVDPAGRANKTVDSVAGGVGAGGLGRFAPMSSTHVVAVAAPDPGGDGGGLGEPRPMAVDAVAAMATGDAGGSLGSDSVPAGDDDADVTMTEAAVEEEVAVAGEVKGAVVEGGDAASDPLYATESAGMVVDERPVDAARGVVVGGGNGGEEEKSSPPEARVLQGEDAGKPVTVEDVAIASATAEPAGAESVKLEENHVDNGKDNGVAHGEMQNNTIADVEGSTEIQEDDGSPTLEEQDDESEMLPLSGATNSNLCARYILPPLDKGGFRVSDLVWAKVKSHPWWPGEIFDPADASELALKHQKKGSHLIAYFGDNTFAWCDESQLKLFVANYSQMEKQSTSGAFVSSVNYALEELSRRILSGMTCSCLPEEPSDNGMSYMVENAGLKEGVTCSAVNRPEILSCFSSENLLNYVKSLALFPGQGGDLLELVIACSQLTSFYRSKGCPELASFQTGSGWVEDGMDTSFIQDVVVDEVVTNEEPPVPDKPKRGRGRPRKQKPEDGLELEKKTTPNLSTDNACDHPAERQMDMEFDDFDGLQSKKRSLDSFEDPETKTTTSTFGSSFKIGECIRRAASQLTGSSSIVKSQNELMPHKNVAETENGDFDVSSDDAIDEFSVEKRAKRRWINRHHNADPKELLSQMCSVAADPVNGHSFSAMIINYFSDYRNYVVSTTTEANIVEKPTAKRGRKRKVLPSPEVETTDHMQDSYWSGLSLHNHPIHDLRRASTSTRPRRRRRSSQDTYFHPQQNLQHGLLSPKKQIQVIERSIIHVDEKIADEVKPTALVLSFGRSTALPSETDLIKMFGRYGPLKESETEVHTSSNTVKVVFKKRADAERAFSFAGKFSTFGPSLRSYRLVNMPFFLVPSQTNNPEAHPECNGLEIPGPSVSKVPLDAAQTEQVDKTDEKIEDKPTTEVKAMETGDDMNTSGALEEITENKATAEGLADNTTEGEITAEMHVEETTTTEKIVEDKELVEETKEGETKAEVNDEETTATEKTVEDKAVPETTEGEATAEVLEESAPTEITVEDNTVSEETTEVETKAEVHVEEATPIDKVVEEKVAGETTKGENTPEVCVEETTTEETAGDKAQDEITKGNASIEEPDETTANDPLEDVTIEEPDKKTTADDPIEDATAEEPDKKTMAAGTIEESDTVEAPDEKTVQDPMVEEGGTKTAVAEETVEPATMEASAGQSGTTEQTG